MTFLNTNPHQPTLNNQPLIKMILDLELIGSNSDSDQMQSPPEGDQMNSLSDEVAQMQSLPDGDQMKSLPEVGQMQSLPANIRDQFHCPTQGTRCPLMKNWQTVRQKS